MKVILLAEVKGKGGEGDVVEVANGFANNYLFPKNLAVAATKGNLKQLEQRKHNIATREENRIAEANKTKEILDALTVKVEARVGEEGVLFGSVTAQMIADAVKAQADIDIDRRRVEIKTAIKSAGTHEVAIQLYRDIKANLTILAMLILLLQQKQLKHLQRLKLKLQKKQRKKLLSNTCLYVRLTYSFKRSFSLTKRPFLYNCVI